MYSYDRRIARVITKADLEPWAADLRRMTKIYRSIPDADEEKRPALYQEAKPLFKTFAENFEAWVYRVVLPSISKERPKTWLEEQVRTKAWTAIMAISLGTLFPSSFNYTTQLHEDAPWKVAEVIDTNVRRYQRAFQAAFKAISDYLDEESQLHGGKPVERRDLVERHTIAGMHVLIHGLGRDEHDYSEDVDAFLHHLDFFAKRIHRAGFGKAVEGLTIQVTFADPSTLSRPTDLTAGLYNAAEDSMMIFPLGFLGSDGGTFTHECGHRFWFRSLTPNARAHWNEVIGKRMTEITKADIDEFTDKYLAKHPEAYTRELQHLVEQSEEDEEKKIKFKELAESSRPITVKTEEVEKLRDILMRQVGEKVHIEDISEYARTSPIEAWAEAFRFYVLKGPAVLGPFTRQFFEMIGRSGGAKLAASRVLARWLHEVVHEKKVDRRRREMVELMTPCGPIMMALDGTPTKCRGGVCTIDGEPV